MAETKSPIDPKKTTLVRVLLQEGCTGDDVLDAFDFTRSAQFYRVATPSALRHRVYVSKEFFDDHTVEEIESLLQSWQMLRRVKQAGARAVIITNGGIEVPGAKENT